MTTDRGLDRLTFFTDAVVAIAVTLLILPLVDVVNESHAAHESATDVVTKHGGQIYTFLLSFAVISRLWFVHHALFEHVKAYSRALLFRNSLWMLMVVILPFATEMVGAYGDQTFAVGLYIATMLVASLCMTSMTYLVAHDDAIRDQDATPDPDMFMRSVVMSALFAAALVIGICIPGAHYSALFILVLSPPVIWIWSHYRRSGAAT